MGSLIVAVLLTGVGADTKPTFVVENKTKPTFVVDNRVRDRFTSNGVTYERGPDGHYRALPGAPGVAPASTFRSNNYHPEHRCPSCKFESPPRGDTWVVRGFNADGTHNHSCPRCGTVWRH